MMCWLKDMVIHFIAGVIEFVYNPSQTDITEVVN